LNRRAYAEVTAFTVITMATAWGLVTLLFALHVHIIVGMAVYLLYLATVLWAGVALDDALIDRIDDAEHAGPPPVTAQRHPNHRPVETHHASILDEESS
jgi:hypothetical protein